MKTGGGAPDALPPTESDERVLETVDPVIIEGIGQAYESKARGQPSLHVAQSVEQSSLSAEVNDATPAPVETPKSRRRVVDKTSARLVAAQERQTEAMESIAASLKELTELVRQQQK